MEETVHQLETKWRRKVVEKEYKTAKVNVLEEESTKIK